MERLGLLQHFKSVIQTHATSKCHNYCWLSQTDWPGCSIVSEPGLKIRRSIPRLTVHIMHSHSLRHTLGKCTQNNTHLKTQTNEHTPAGCWVTFADRKRFWLQAYCTFKREEKNQRHDLQTSLKKSIPGEIPAEQTSRIVDFRHILSDTALALLANLWLLSDRCLVHGRSWIYANALSRCGCDAWCFSWQQAMTP